LARSHGPALGCIVEGCPPGLELTEADLQGDVDRRRTGTSQFVSQRKEGDEVSILSGVFEGKTTGTAIGILIENTDARSRDYEKIKDRFRPGHATTPISRSSGFATTAAVVVRRRARPSCASRPARLHAKYLHARLGVSISGYLSQIGSLILEPVNRPLPTTTRSSARSLASARARRAHVEDSRRGRFRGRESHRDRARRAAGLG
jgi:chorismate synthase